MSERRGRVEARDKVTGRAAYAYEHTVRGVAYAQVIQATVARGRIRSIDASDALALPGVLHVLSHENAPKLRTADAELAVLQSDAIPYRGRIVAAVVAETLEIARDAAGLVRVEYAAEPHDVTLRDDHPGLYVPDVVNPAFPAVTEHGTPSFGDAAVAVDATYTTPPLHNNPMEPHAALAVWDEAGLTLYDSTQGPSRHRDTVARALGIAPERVRVISRHVGGGFGSKGTAHAHTIVAALCAQAVGRPVKLALTRQQMFELTGYRTPTIQRVRLAADAEGRLTSIAHEVVEQTSRIKVFAEQTATPTRVMYAAPNRRTAHRLARLDVPTPSWMRAPGECPGMFALECAMDELADACGLDPIELRVRNEPAADPESGLPFSSRNLVACLREGARRFGWAERARRREGRRLIGAGVAAATYPAYLAPSRASARAEDDRFVVRVAAADIGTGARTVLGRIAAETLDVPAGRVEVELGDSALPDASLAAGSSGTASWGLAVVRACENLLKNGSEGTADTAEEVGERAAFSRHAFGAQFAEVAVDMDTGEVRVPRMLGVFAAGRIVEPDLARSQFIGGMTMGLSMALLEETAMDPGPGGFVNRDLAQYHIAACADVRDIDATWIEEDDPHLNPMGSKGIGEIGIVGAAAAIANAVYHATGQRIRDLPIRPDRLLPSR